ncbi:DNA-protecting protein DprA [Ectothiorhodospiraceae bacterium BW-2]|nr:DNA-protecting protein DprA [Ectothiorhodospiraceae bacterium BW-2]
MSSEQARLWFKLARVSGVGAIRQQQLLQRYGSVEAIFAQGPHDSSLTAALRQALTEVDEAAVDDDMAWLEQSERHFLLTVADEAYPPQLRQLEGMPQLLYGIGRVELLQSAQVAMVGSRNPSHQGQESAHAFARYFASVGLTVTSGLALGIDGASHCGALDGGGDTIAVMGTGIDRIYPASHRDLAHRIAANGSLLVSEFPPGVGPLASNFPRRNRLLSALSLGTLVVEAALKSGSLITARYASEQGREVFAIPGSIHNPLAKGCHQLIKQGAKLVEGAQDIIEEIAPQLRHYLTQLDQADSLSVAKKFTVTEQQLIHAIGDGPTPMDTIIARSGLTADRVSSMLLQLELEGHVSFSPAGYSV